MGRLVAVLMLISTAAVAGSSKWIYHSRKDPITGATIRFAATAGNKGAQLTIRCKNRQVQATVRISHLDYVLGDVREVTYRADGDDPVTSTWHVREGDTMLIGEEAVAFARIVMGARSRVAIENSNGGTVFGVRGSTYTIKRLLKSCGVKPKPKSANAPATKVGRATQ